MKQLIIISSQKYLNKSPTVNYFFYFVAILSRSNDLTRVFFIDFIYHYVISSSKLILQYKVLLEVF